MYLLIQLNLGLPFLLVVFSVIYVSYLPHPPFLVFLSFLEGGEWLIRYILVFPFNTSIGFLVTHLCNFFLEVTLVITICILNLLVNLELCIYCSTLGKM